MQVNDPVFLGLLGAILVLNWALFFRIGWFRAIMKMGGEANKTFRENSKGKNEQFNTGAKQVADIAEKKAQLVHTLESTKQEYSLKIEQAKKEQEILRQKLAENESLLMK